MVKDRITVNFSTFFYLLAKRNNGRLFKNLKLTPMWNLIMSENQRRNFRKSAPFKSILSFNLFFFTCFLFKFPFLPAHWNTHIHTHMHTYTRTHELTNIPITGDPLHSSILASTLSKMWKLYKWKLWKHKTNISKRTLCTKIK